MTGHLLVNLGFLIFGFSDFRWAPVSEPGKIEFFIKSSFFVIQVEIGEV